MTVKGPTMFTGAVTGQEYWVPRGETRELEGPEGEFSLVPEDRRVSPSRSVEASGSWKTFYEGGEEVDKVQCSKDEAEQWANGTLSLDEIK